MISVIVPARNASAHIAQCLTALQKQSISETQFEILVIDNGSADNTVAVAREFTDRVHALPGAVVGKVRNYGAELARGDTLAFIDADCVASPTWLAGANAALSEGGIAVGNKYDLPQSAWIERLWLGEPVRGRVRATELWSGNLVLRRDDFFACGAFDERLVSYEDVVLSLALDARGELFYDERVRVTHIGGPRTLMAFARQQLWHGFEEVSVFRREIPRGTFAPAIACGGGYALVLAALVAPTHRVPLAVAGATIIAGATAWHLIPQYRFREGRTPQMLLPLALLNLVSLSARALAMVIRALGLQWSGR